MRLPEVGPDTRGKATLPFPKTSGAGPKRLLKITCFVLLRPREYALRSLVGPPEISFFSLAAHVCLHYVSASSSAMALRDRLLRLYSMRVTHFKAPLKKQVVRLHHHVALGSAIRRLAVCLTALSSTSTTTASATALRRHSLVSLCPIWVALMDF